VLWGGRHERTKTQTKIHVGFPVLCRAHALRFLFVERIGITGVTILISLSLQEADSRKVPSRRRIKEILQVVLMIGRARMADLCQRGRTRMRRLL